MVVEYRDPLFWRAFPAPWGASREVFFWRFAARPRAFIDLRQQIARDV